MVDRAYALAVLLLICLIPAKATAEQPRNPVIVVPGILGSRLCDQNNTVLWGGTARTTFKTFHRLDLSVEHPEPLHPCGIVTEVQVLGPLYSVDGYEKLVDSLQAFGFTLNKDLYVFDYDWRLSNVDTAQALQRFIDAKLPANQKFSIVAHSMGGIVTRLYLDNTKPNARVEKVIYLGTPFYGSANTLGMLSEGWGPIQNWVAGGIETIRQVSLSFPSLLELLPRYKDCCSLKIGPGTYQPVDVFDASRWKELGWLPERETREPTYGTFRRNLERARELSAILSAPAANQIEIKFAGTPKSTRFIFVTEAKSADPSSWRFSLDRGDGTVPAWSAARDPSLKDLSGSFQSFSNHATIFNDEWVLAQLRRELLETKAIVDRPISGEGPQALTVMVDGVKRRWPLDRITVAPSNTFVPPEGQAQAVIEFVFEDGTKNIKAGAYRPTVLLLQDGTSTPMVVDETSTPNGVANRKLSFAATLPAKDLGEGAAEIVVEITSEQGARQLGEYIVIMR